MAATLARRAVAAAVRTTVHSRLATAVVAPLAARTGTALLSTTTAAPAAAGAGGLTNATLSPLAPLRKITVAYGSQTGTGQAFAAQLVEHLNDAGTAAAGSTPGWEAELVDLAEFDHAGMLPRSTPDSAVIFVVSCFGRGEPTDTAKKFYTWLQGQSGGQALSSLNYAVFGLGSSATHKEYFNVVGRNVDAKLEALGGHRMFPRGIGDDSGCIDLDFESWEKELLAALQALAAPPATGTTAAATPSPPPKPVIGFRRGSPYHSEGECSVRLVPPVAACDIGTPQGRAAKATPPPLPGRAVPVAALRCLTPGDFRPAYELSVALRPEDGLRYDTGDHVAVYPENGYDRVSALCDRMGWDPMWEFRVEGASKLPATAPGTATTVREALTKMVDISGALTPHVLRTLASHCGQTAEGEKLAGLADKGSYTVAVRDRYLSLSDVLAIAPSLTLPLDRFLATFPPMQPRYYSVSSSARVHQASDGSGAMHITFRHLRVPRWDGSVFEGLCSTYMAQRAVGDRMRVAVRPSDFRLPVDLTRPVLMVAGGIGIAPFKAFLEELMSRPAAAAATAARAAAAKSMLLYGCRDASDQLYKDLANAAVNAGVLGEWDVGYAAPSRSTLAFTPRPRLAHELVDEHGAAVWRLLSEGGLVYVCGGAAGFGRAVADAVKRVAVDHGQLSPDAAEAWMSSLLASNRYLEDLAD